MAFHIGVGVSGQIQRAEAAGEEAATSAREQLKDKTPELVVVLASSLYDQEAMLRGVRRAIPDAPLVGCTTAGLITNDGPQEHVVGVMTLHGDNSSFHPIKIESISSSMRDGGKRFGDAVKSESGGEAKMALLFSDALSGNGTELVRGIFEVLGNSFPLAGGAAGDEMNFKKTSQYFNDEVLNNAAVGVAITGDIQYGVGADHGWQPIGKEYKVTKAEGTTLFALDGKPAFSVYQEYFGERASDFKSALSLAAVSYPLGMRTDGTDKFIIRVPLAVKDDGSIVCGAELIEGSTVSLMIGTISSALWAAQEKVRELVAHALDAQPKVLFLSDCVARKVLFGERGKEEIDGLKTLVGKGTQIFGFYSYGQIAPFFGEPVNINTCDPGFYEQSISMAIFGERATKG